LRHADEVPGVEARANEGRGVLDGRENDLGRPPAMPALPRRPMRMNSRWRSLFFAELVEAVEAVRVRVGGERLDSERGRELEPFLVGVVVLRERLDAVRTGVTPLSLQSESTALICSGVLSSGT